MRHYGHEKLIIISRPEARLRAVIAIYDRILGLALGGCRLLPYTNEEQMIEDVLRLSRAMTYKSAMAGMTRAGVNA